MWKRILLTGIVFIFGIAAAFADCEEVPNPGTPDDPGYDPNGCPVPLDTWVIVLVVVAVIYGAYRLQKKQAILFKQTVQ